jgi:hypothetical protein
MSTSFPLLHVVRRSLALTAFLGAGVALMGAQTPDPASSATAATAAPVVSTPQFSSSSTSEDESAPAAAPAPAAGNQLASNAMHFNLFGNAMQYGGRQSYGKPRYRGSNTNADGSPKYDFYIGGGFTLPTEQTHTNNTVSYGIQGGGGRMFNKASASRTTPSPTICT